MKRRRLSSKLLFDKIIILIICLVALPYWFYNYPDLRYIFIGGWLTIAVISYFVFYLPDTIEFDEEKMHIIKRN